MKISAIDNRYQPLLFRLCSSKYIFSMYFDEHSKELSQKNYYFVKRRRFNT